MIALGLVWLLNVKVAPDNGGISDLGGYQATADAIANGQVPYRDFFLEYPPVAAGVFVVAGWIGGLSPGGYLNGMAIEMLVFAWAAQLCSTWLAPKRHQAMVAWAFVALPLLVGTLVRERFDVAPTALCAIAIYALATGRYRTGFVVLGVGTAMKLFPLVLVPIGVVWLLAQMLKRQALTGALLAIATALLLCVPFFAASPRGFDEQFRFHLDRPVQIESTPASVLFALGGSVVNGTTTRPSPYRSQGIVGGHANTVKVLFEVAEIAAFALLLWGTWRAALTTRGRPDDATDVLVLAATGALLAFMALGKVFSVQYMIWLAPFAAVVWARGQRDIAAAILAAYVLTWAYYPHHYFELVFQGATHNAVVITLAVRNLLLVCALGLVIVRLWNRRAGPVSAAVGPPVAAE